MNYISAFMVISSCFALVACQNADRAGQHEQAAMNVELRAEQILQKMTLEEKVGQIIQADIASVTPAEVKEYNLGSVLNGGNSAPGGGKVADPEDWIALADALWDASTDRSDGGVGIPVIWGADAVHGHNNLQSATIFPHNSGLGAANDPDLLKRIGAVTAREVRATGLDWTFAPTLAVAQDDRWGRAYESYSENPEIVAAYSRAMVEGLQGDPASPHFLKGDKVLATAKHFLADGGTQYGIDKGDTQGNVRDIIALHGAGYPPAINAGVQSVMASFSSINGEKMHGATYFLNDILRGEMGFTGFVVGDWNGHAEVPGCTPTDCLASFNAGVDMFMAPDSWRGLYGSLLAHAKSGALSMDRLDEAVLRILKAKIRGGLFEAGRPSQRPTTNAALLGAAEHRAVAREAVRKSLVLLKNNQSLLPLKQGQKILVTGSGAHSMQQQTGGWTLSWQGNSNANEEFLTGETIFSGIQKAVSKAGGKAVLSVDGRYSEKPDVAIVVFGEEPYAEYRGDRKDLVFEFEDGANLRLLRDLKSQGIPVVSVFLTGRPLWVNPHINSSDAFVVAWLPGTEAGGVADVLIGDKDGKPRFDFTGRLAFSWPDDGRGEPINAQDQDGVLFPFGYGLSYAVSSNLIALSEESGVDNAASAFTGDILARGNASQPFSVYLGDSSNANTPAMVLESASLGGIIKTRGVDYRAQEDARQIIWSGKSEGSFSVRSSRPLDLSKMGDANHLFLTLLWRVDEWDRGSVVLGMGCGESCVGSQDISALIEKMPVGTWEKTELPLKCFIEAGLDVRHVESILNLTNASAARFSVHSAELRYDESKTLECPS